MIQKVIDIDQRYRSSWDVRAIAHVVKISPTTVADILRDVRGPRPQLARHPHRGRTCFIDRDVMWSSKKSLPRASCIAACRPRPK